MEVRFCPMMHQDPHTIEVALGRCIVQRCVPPPALRHNHHIGTCGIRTMREEKRGKQEEEGEVERQKVGGHPHPNRTQTE